MVDAMGGRDVPAMLGKKDRRRSQMKPMKRIPIQAAKAIAYDGLLEAVKYVLVEVGYPAHIHDEKESSR